MGYCVVALRGRRIGEIARPPSGIFDARGAQGAPMRMGEAQTPDLVERKRKDFKNLSYVVNASPP